MRFWLSGPRIGFIRPGISFNLRPRRYASAQRNAAAAFGEFVYVVENQQNGHNKIGYSGDPKGNLASLQRGSSVPLSLAFTIFAADRAFDVEQEAHAILDRERLEGEWFSVPREAAIAAVYAAAARLKVPLGDDVPTEGVSMERKIVGIAMTAVILFGAYAVSSGLPMKANRWILGAVIVVLLWRRWIGWPFTRKNLSPN